MKLRKIVQTRLVKALVTALLVGSLANTGFTVKAEEILPDDENTAVETESVSGNDGMVTAEGLAAAGGVQMMAGAVATQKKYPTISRVILAGGRLAIWLGGQEATRTVYPNIYRPADGDFTLLAGHKMTLNDAGTFGGLTVDYTGVDDDGKLTGGNGANWQCVGFVPFEVKKGYTDDKPADLLHYVYYSGNSEGTSYYDANCGKTLEEVEQYISDNNGILYGEEVSEGFMDQLLVIGKAYSQVTIATVWYVTTAEDTWTNYEGYHYEIPSASAVDYYKYPAGTVTVKQNADGAAFHYDSEGVTITTTPALVQYREDGTGKVTYDNATITITIHSNAPDSVKINLTDAIGYLNGTVTGENAAEPGDTLYYTLKFVNESKRNYQYSPTTAKIGTIPAKELETGEKGSIPPTGFEGYMIGEVGEFATFPRRILNAPLRNLGITGGKVTDTVVGEALLKKGYGSKDMKPEEITRTCLAQYYLDWFNNTSRKEENKVRSFTELTAGELAILTNGTADTTVLESCPAVAEALYYTAYHNVYTFDGKGLYDRMQENGKEDSYADALVSDLLSRGEAKITSNLSGELANNGYQMTRYGFGMQFALYCEPTTTIPPETTPSPTPTVTPETTPSPTPTVTPETTPSPTPTATPEMTPGPTPTVTPETTPSPTPTATPDTPAPSDDDEDDNDTPATPGTPGTPSEPATPFTPQVLGVRRQRVVSITDDPTPLSDRAVLGASRRPQTGDDSNVWNLGFLFSLTGLAAWVIIKKKEH